MDSHLVYFLGGPMDLSKKVYEGERPRETRLVMREPKPININAYERGGELPDKQYLVEDHLYNLYQVPPVQKGGNPQRTYIAIYDQTI